MNTDYINTFGGSQVKAYADECAKQACSGAQAPRASYTLAEESFKAEQYHSQEATKAASAHNFLSAHPEFDEFVRLVRSGAIRF